MECFEVYQAYSFLITPRIYNLMIVINRLMNSLEYKYIYINNVMMMVINNLMNSLEYNINKV